MKTTIYNRLVLKLVEAFLDLRNENDIDDIILDFLTTDSELIESGYVMTPPGEDDVAYWKSVMKDDLESFIDEL